MIITRIMTVTTVRPEPFEFAQESPVEACPELVTTVRPEPVEGRSWFDKALLSIVEGLTTNGIVVVITSVIQQ